MEKPTRKFAYYAKTQDIINELEKVPKRQMSQRLEELVQKGMAFEKEERLREAYADYGADLSKEDELEDREDHKIMSSSLFEDEDEIEGWY